MAFELPSLPYDMNSLEPHISKETLEYHYGKHHQAYVNKLNDAISGTSYESMSLEQVIRDSREKNEMGVFNNAAQTWNHSFYWNCLSGKKTSPGENTTKAINESFGSLDKFKEEFSNAAATQFGSGWAWLVKNTEGKLQVVKTSNAESPVTMGHTVLLTCDVWEHAYYIDYRNARPKYIEAFWNLVNWDFIESNLK